MTTPDDEPEIPESDLSESGGWDDRQEDGLPDADRDVLPDGDVTGSPPGLDTPTEAPD